MKFQPKTKEELSNLLTEGEAHFEVIEAQETKSKSSGNDMIVLKVRVVDINGKVGTVDSYLATEWSVRNFAYSAGLVEEYEKGEITANDCLCRGDGKGEGKCIIKIKKGEMGERGQYPDKNAIARYIEIEDQSKKPANDFKDDDINF